MPPPSDPILAANIRLYRSAAASMGGTVSAAPEAAECLSLGADPLFRPSPGLLHTGHGGYIADGVFVAVPSEKEGGMGGEERDAMRMPSSLEVLCSQNCLDAVALLMDALVRRTADKDWPVPSTDAPPTLIPPAAAALLPPLLLRSTCSDTLQYPAVSTRMVNYLLSLRTVDVEGGGERPVFPIDAWGPRQGGGSGLPSDPPLLHIHTNTRTVRALLANGADINVPAPRECPSASRAADAALNGVALKEESLFHQGWRQMPSNEDFFLFPEASKLRFQFVPPCTLQALLDNGYDPDPSLLAMCTDDTTCSRECGDEGALSDPSADGGGARDSCLRGHEGCSVRHIAGCTCTPRGRLSLLSAGYAIATIVAKKRRELGAILAAEMSSVPPDRTRAFSESNGDEGSAAPSAA